jgi:hypothetical protein
LEPVRPRERKDARRLLISAFIFAPVWVVIVLIAFVIHPFGVWWANLSVIVLLIAIFAVSALLLVEALRPRPASVTITNEGVEFQFQAGRTRLLKWADWASYARLEHLTTEFGDMPAGDRVRIRRPVPYSFWVTEDVQQAVRDGARRAGLTEASEEWSVRLVSGDRRSLGTRTTFRNG